ncbi:MAG: sulfotransferase [Calditrichaeota bacterium]|nr:sulfotransferase [Calditrichota bacterium]
MDHRFLFIAGLHRSGTSILHRGIRQHPEISGFQNTGVPEDEGQHLQTVFPPAIQLGGPGRFAFHPRAHLTEHSSLVTPENREQLLKEWGQYWDLQKPVLVEKSPKNLTQTRFLQALFPNSYFLIILRHPIVVALATQKWARWKTMAYLVKHWIHAHRIFKEDAVHLNHFRIVYYEQFVLQPEKHFQRIFEWIGVAPFQPDQEVKNANSKYSDRWKAINGWYKRYLAYRFEAPVRQFGYQLHDLQTLADCPDFWKHHLLIPEGTP